MRTRPIALAAALAAPAALALAGCASTQNSAVDAAGPITVAASDTTCEVARTQAPAGQVEFTITNTGSKTNEFYVYAQCRTASCAAPSSPPTIPSCWHITSG